MSSASVIACNNRSRVAVRALTSSKSKGVERERQSLICFIAWSDMGIYV